MNQGNLFEQIGNTLLPRRDFTAPRFNGSDYDPEKDDVRLRGQIERVFNLMKDGIWRTLSEIEMETHDPPASISAQLRHLRKRRFGAHTINKRPRGDREHGLFEYQLLVTTEDSGELQVVVQD